MALVQNVSINGDTLVGGGSWTNSDGLTLYYGVQEAQLASGGVFEDTESGRLVHEYIVDLSALITASPTQVSRDHFPNNFVIDKAEVFVETAAASSGSGTFNLGLWDLTAAATISDTAVIAAMTTAIMTAGALITVILNPAGSTAWGSTYAGANMGLVGYAWTQPPTGAALPHDVVFTAKAGTAVFQSGVVRVKVYAHRTLHADTTYSPGGQD